MILTYGHQNAYLRKQLTIASWDTPEFEMTVAQLLEANENAASGREGPGPFMDRASTIQQAARDRVDFPQILHTETGSRLIHAQNDACILAHAIPTAWLVCCEARGQVHANCRGEARPECASPWQSCTLSLECICRSMFWVGCEAKSGVWTNAF